MARQDFERTLDDAILAEVAKVDDLLRGARVSQVECGGGEQFLDGPDLTVRANALAEELIGCSHGRLLK